MVVSSPGAVRARAQAVAKARVQAVAVKAGASLARVVVRVLAANSPVGASLPERAGAFPPTACLPDVARVRMQPRVAEIRPILPAVNHP
jgi:hypothetical protein